MSNNINANIYQFTQQLLGVYVNIKLNPGNILPTLTQKYFE